MHYNETPHALNLKEKDAIVYVDVFGEIIQVTAESLGREEFKKWKEWSDEDFHEEAKEEHIYRNHTVSIEGISSAKYAVPDHETLMIEEEERREREALKQQIEVAFFACLTDIQQTRLWLYAIEGMSSYRISEVEGATRQAVCASLNKARKNIISFLEKRGCQLPCLPAYSEGVIK